MKEPILLVFLFCFAFTAKGQDNLELIVKNKIDHLSELAREPMIAEHPSGTLFLTGYRNASDVPQLWKSSDQGKNWEKVNVGTREAGARGNSDVDLLIDKEGNIFLLSMTFTKLPDDLQSFDFSTLKGEQITLGISRDLGKTWKWQTISQNDNDDRPWIATTTNGDLHIIWNDGHGVHHSISRDKGYNWTRQAQIHPQGGSSFIASGHTGQLAVRVTPLSASGNKIDPGVDLVRLSLDNGKTWKKVNLPGKRSWALGFGGIPRWVEPLAFDQEDRLYTMWSEGKILKMGISIDNGENWEEHIVEQSKDTIYYPYLKPAGNSLLCSWISGFNANIRHCAAILKVENSELTVYKMDAQKLDIRSRFGIGENQLSTGGEYFPIIPLSNGNYGMATTIQNSKSNRLGFTWWELLLSEY